MTADLQFTKRFHKEAQSRAFSEALPALQKYLDLILHQGPTPNKSRIKQLARGKKGSIWRIGIAPKSAAPHRLLFEWISHGTTPTLLLLCFIARKDKQYANKHASVFEAYSNNRLEGKAEEDLRKRILDQDQPVEPIDEDSSAEMDSDGPPDPSTQYEEAANDHDAEVLLEVTVEEAQVDDLIELYASQELVHKFAAVQGWGPETCAGLAACETTDEAVEFIHAYDEELDECFLQFLLDDESTSDLDRIRKVRSGELSSICERPLSHFMLTVDPEQQSAINRPLGSKPFMVRGSAGTGKSVVCLYRLKRMLQERTNELLIDQNKRPRYLFLSYTNALVENAKSLFMDLCSDMDLRDVDLEFRTLHRVLSEMADTFRDAGHQIPEIDKRMLDTAYWSTIKSSEVDQETRRLLEKMGPIFFAHEVEEVLIDKNVTTLDQYLEKGAKTKKLRKGLVISLTDNYRKAIWYAYRKLEESMEKGSASWGQFHQRILHLTTKYPELVAQYNVVFADEVQDFGDIQMKLITKLCTHPSGIVFASDIGQTIYRRQSAMSDIDDTLQFNRSNSILLKRSYRMTQEISTALQPLRGQMARLHGKQHELATPVYTGSKPNWIKAPFHMHQEKTVELIVRQRRNSELNLGQFAVLFATNREAEDFHAYCQTARCITAKFHSKGRNIDLRENTVHILTVHSAKGLEFPRVIIPFANKLCGDPKTETADTNRFDLKEHEDSNNKLLYVACSRASENLTLIQETNSQPSALDYLNPDDWEIEEHPHEEYRA